MLKGHNSEELEKAVKQGKADSRIVPFCRHINSLKNFFTSSSCAGRITLLSVKSISKKQPKAFHRKWHRSVSVKEVLEGIEEKSMEKELWFKLDPFILHIGAMDLESAKKVLKCMRHAGIKRGGIMLAQEQKFMVELQGTNAMSLPVKNKGKTLLEKEYIEFIVKQANQKLGENYKRLELFEKTCRKEL